MHSPLHALHLKGQLLVPPQSHHMTQAIAEGQGVAAARAAADAIAIGGVSTATAQASASAFASGASPLLKQGHMDCTQHPVKSYAA
jgi:hypothetical protein